MITMSSSILPDLEATCLTPSLMFTFTGFGAFVGLSLFPAVGCIADVSSALLGCFFTSAYTSPFIGPTA